MNGKTRPTRLLGARTGAETLGAVRFGGAFYVLTQNEFAHRCWLSRVTIPRSRRWRSNERQ